MAVGVKREGWPLQTLLSTCLDRPVLLRAHVDNTAAIAAVRHGYSPALRHLARTERIALGVLHEAFYKGGQPGLTLPCELAHCPTSQQKADILTKAMVKPVYDGAKRSIGLRAGAVDAEVADAAVATSVGVALVAFADFEHKKSNDTDTHLAQTRPALQVSQVTPAEASVATAVSESVGVIHAEAISCQDGKHRIRGEPNDRVLAVRTVSEGGVISTDLTGGSVMRAGGNRAPMLAHGAGPVRPALQPTRRSWTHPWLTCAGRGSSSGFAAQGYVGLGWLMAWCCDPHLTGIRPTPRRDSSRVGSECLDGPTNDACGGNSSVLDESWVSGGVPTRKSRGITLSA